MIAVAILAIVMGGGVWAAKMWWLSHDFRTQAAMHRVWERSWRSDGRMQFAEYHARMRRRYEDAARHPWRPVGPDPQDGLGDHPVAGTGGTEWGDDEVETGDGSVRITLALIPKPDGEPYHHGDPIPCKGTLSWQGVEPPEEVEVFLYPGLFPGPNLPSCWEKSVPVRVISKGHDSRSGIAEWEASLHANRASGIDVYHIEACPVAQGFRSYHHEGTPIRAFARLKISR
jgi:hypothetical protein